MRTKFRDFYLPSLARFTSDVGAKLSVWDVVSPSPLLKSCPWFEFIQICLSYMPRSPATPPPAAGLPSRLLDHLILPKYHSPSIERLFTTRGIAKVVATPNACNFSCPNGNHRFWCLVGSFDADVALSSLPLSLDRGLRVGRRTTLLSVMTATMAAATTKYNHNRHSGTLKQTTAEVCRMFGAPTKAGDLSHYRLRNTTDSRDTRNRSGLRFPNYEDSRSTLGMGICVYRLLSGVGRRGSSASGQLGKRLWFGREIQGWWCAGG